MKLVFFIALILSGIQLKAQSLFFTEFGSEPAYCRTSGTQNGNGIVYAAAGGGTPDYTYVWKDLQTGATNGSTTWGGLNPGCYEITVTDNVGDQLIDTLCLDSINPIADFMAVDPDLFPYGTGYAGAGTSESRFLADAENYVDPLFNWNFDYPSGSWWLQTMEENTPMQTFDAVPGYYEVALIVSNHNGCADTMVKPIVIGVAGVEEIKTDFEIKMVNQSLSITSAENGVITIYDLSGRIVYTDVVNKGSQVISADLKSGIYVYTMTGVDGQINHSDKIVIQ